MIKQAKTLEKDPSEIEISNLPDRVQSNGHKDAYKNKRRMDEHSENCKKETKK